MDLQHYLYNASILQKSPACFEHHLLENNAYKIAQAWT